MLKCYADSKQIDFISMNDLGKYIVVTIQKVHRSRKLILKSRKVYLKYYWENLKGDMSKILISET